MPEVSGSEQVIEVGVDDYDVAPGSYILIALGMLIFTFSVR